MASAASTTTSQMKIIDLIIVSTQRIASKSPPGSPIRPFEMSAFQNEGLRSLLDMMRARINIVLSPFETQRHVTKETKGTITELAALNTKAIQLQEGAGKEASSRNTSTQTEARQTKDRIAAAPRNVVKPHPVLPSKPSKNKVKEVHPLSQSKPGTTATVKEAYAKAGGYYPQEDWRSFVRRYVPNAESRSQVK